MKKTILVLNIDTIKNKNIYQFNSMKEYGYSYHCFGYLDDHTTEFCENYFYEKYPKGIIKRFSTIAKTIWNQKRNLSHIELYTGGGSFLLIEYLIGKLVGIKICLVERGSPLLVIDSHYGRLARVARKLIYKKADFIWIRELWMKDALKKLGRKKFFFQSNAIELSNQFNHTFDKSNDFIWCNSLKKWRNVDWFIDSLNSSDFESSKSIVLGFLDDNRTVEPQQEYVLKQRTESTEVLPFQDPSSHLIRSKYFVLPADIVYLNFSLLEAMSYGVVPIVSNVEGVGEIVSDGIDGLVAEHSKKGLISAMQRAKKLSEKEYERMSKNAREKIVNKFSIDRWSANLNDFYKEIQSK